MNRSWILLAAGLLGLAFSGAASAAQIDWHGTLESKLGAGKRFNDDGSRRGLTGSGVATVNGSGGGSVLNSLQLAGGITGSAFVPVTDPESVGTIPSIRVFGTLGSGNLGDIASPPLAGGSNTLAVKGVARVCLFDIGACDGGGYLPLPLSINSGNTALGVGGQLTIGRFGSIRISLQAQPWTIGSATAINQTHEGGFKTVTASGFLHTAGSAASASGLAAGSGVIQMVAPSQVTTTGISGNSAKLSLFAIMTLHFIPEPGFLLLVGAGAVGLGILGRNRMRQ
jgi:hypothetical protein